MPPPSKKLRQIIGQSILNFSRTSGKLIIGAAGNKVDDSRVPMEMTQMSRVAAENRFGIVGVPGDGNCGYNAVVDQLASHGVCVDASSLRAQAVSYLNDHPQLIDQNFLVSKQYPSVFTYLTKQATDGTWVDEMMLRAVSSCISRDIHILHDNGYTSKLENPENRHEPINLGLIGEVHYVSLHLDAHTAHDANISASGARCKDAECTDNSIDKSQSSASSTCAEAPDTASSQSVQLQSENSEPNAQYHENNNQNRDAVDKAAEQRRDETSSAWPSVWSTDIWIEKKKSYPFLFCKDGSIGCEYCRDVGSVQTSSGPGLGLAVEWVTCQVRPTATGRKQQLRSLRKKIHKHAQSLTHVKAHRILVQSRKQRLETAVMKMSADEEQMTCKALRTAYYLAMNNRPFSDYTGLLDLQKSNGTELGLGLTSRYSAKEMLVHIARDMRMTACQHIKSTGRHIAVLIDEATTISNKSTLIIYLKCTSVPTSEAHFMFLDLVELENQTANTIVATLLNCLAMFGFDDNYLAEHLIAFASDGASVMTGNKSGVAVQLATKYPNIITWHCLNHRIELAVADAADDVRGVNHFRSFMDALYSLYSRSPKTQKTLAIQAAQLDVQIKKIGRVLNTRWVASSFRAVDAVWNNFSCLAAHFESSCNPSSTYFDKELRSTFSGLRTKLCSPQFVEDLALMYDCLEELKFLSESMQKRKMTVPEADKLIRRTIRRIEGLKEKPGLKMTEAESARQSLLLGVVRLSPNSKHVVINHNQFLQSLADNLKRRLLRVTSDGSGTHVASGFTQKQESHCNKLIDQLAVLNPDNWPAEMKVDYGEEEIRLLCRRFRLHYVTARDAFSDFKDSGGRRMPLDLHLLMNAVHTIPVSTAECERGFSSMNVILGELRAKLLIEHVSALLFVKLHGPPLKQWQPLRYVKTWLLKHRSANDTRTRISTSTGGTYMQQPDGCPDPLWNIL